MRDFIVARVVQLTHEETPVTFSAVHMASCMPYLAARIWLKIAPIAQEGDRNVKGFLSNLWAAQLCLSDELMTEREWERVFWTDVVTKGERTKF